MVFFLFTMQFCNQVVWPYKYQCICIHWKNRAKSCSCSRAIIQAPMLFIQTFRKNEIHHHIYEKTERQRLNFNMQWSEISTVSRRNTNTISFNATVVVTLLAYCFKPIQTIICMCCVSSLLATQTVDGEKFWLKLFDRSLIYNALSKSLVDNLFLKSLNIIWTEHRSIFSVSVLIIKKINQLANGKSSTWRKSAAKVRVFIWLKKCNVYSTVVMPLQKNPNHDTLVTHCVTVTQNYECFGWKIWF